MIEVLLNFSMKKEKREYQFLCLSTEQRHRLLEKHSPSIVQQVTQMILRGIWGLRWWL